MHGGTEVKAKIKQILKIRNSRIGRTKSVKTKGRKENQTTKTYLKIKKP
jgi:hypothetical protein